MQSTHFVTAEGHSNIIASFVVPGDPASKSRARFTKRGSKTYAYTPERVKVGEAKIAAGFLNVTHKRGTDKEATYGVSCRFYNATRQSRDVDNMIKLVLDGLNGVAYPDDNQVTEVSGSKEYVGKENARTEVTVYRIGVIDRLRHTCEQCGKEFVTYDSLKDKVRFCSRECASAAQAKKVQTEYTRTCEQCGKTFVRRTHGHRSEARFCSRECSAEHGRIDVTCVVCGTVTRQRRSTANKFCSDACSHRWYRAEAKKAGKGRGTCETCGGPVTRKEYRQCRPCRLANPLPHKVSRRGNPKLTDEQVRAIRSESTDGATTRELATKYGLHIATVQRVVRGESYAHIK